MRFHLSLILVVVLIGPSFAADDLGLRVAPGFKVTLYSDHELANDIYSMTLDAQGRVVVSSRGWVKTLHDTKGGGRPDKATLFAVTPKGGMGLAFDGPDLLFTGDDWFSRYRDPSGKGQADGPPEKISPLAFNEHGGHAARQGPDGCWYVIGGNDTRFSRAKHINVANSLVREPEAGGIMRFSPDFKQFELIAHGYRNPYRFDFNPQGDLFTYDSDTERDLFLPWYSQTRVYHVAPGGHHGWRLEGYLRSWCRPEYYLDTVDILRPIGRGSPTGVVCYRHEQFPEHYRGGIFCCDWTFGKVFFLPLKLKGASYETKAEIFIEPKGTNGFNPTDAVVTPDGALLISIGGRGTRGAIYKVEYVGADQAPSRPHAAKSQLAAVLQAPQPLEAWSRERWVPLAKKLGPVPFSAAVLNEKLDELARLRAIEVLTELFGGLPTATAQAASRAPSPLVRARAAWSLGRAPAKECGPLLAQLARDADPRVRSFALTALTERIDLIDPESIRPGLVENLGHKDKRVVGAAALLASRLPEPTWQKLRSELAKAPLAARLGGGLAAVWRQPDADLDGVVPIALEVIAATEDPPLRLQAIRLLQLAFGDFQLQNPAVDAYTGFSFQRSLAGKEALVRKTAAAVRPLFPSADDLVNLEAARLLAMFGDAEPALPGRVAALWTQDSSASRDVHYLVVMARLRAPLSKPLIARIAQVVLGLHRKLQGQEQRDKQNWNTRITEIVSDMVRREPALAEALLGNPALIEPAHAALAAGLTPAERQKAARLFLAAAQKNADFEWSSPLIELFKLLPAAEVRPALRARWTNFGLRDSIVLQLAQAPEEADRDKFLTGLESEQTEVIRACLAALDQLPRDPAPERLVPVLTLLRRLVQEPKQAPLGRQALALVARQSATRITIDEKAADTGQLLALYQPVLDSFKKKHPALVGKLEGTEGTDTAFWDRLLVQVDWSKGNVAPGEKLFRERGCATCHSGNSRIGPDLAGITSRFSRPDLLGAIIYPSRDVAPAYRVSNVLTRDGKLHAGVVVFYSADGFILQTGATTTLRIAAAEVDSRIPTTKSLMPVGLLKDLKPQDVADLYSYLETLKAPKN